MFDEVTNILDEFAVTESSILADLSNSSGYLLGEEDTDLILFADDETMTEVQ